MPFAALRFASLKNEIDIIIIIIMILLPLKLSLPFLHEGAHPLLLILGGKEHVEILSLKQQPLLQRSAE